MANALDYTDFTDVDASAKVVELQREWERSRALLEELETIFTRSAPGAEQSEALETKAWPPVGADDASFSVSELARCAKPADTAPSDGCGPRNTPRSRRGLSDVVTSEAPDPRRMYAPQVHMKFEPLDALRVSGTEFGEDGSALRQGLLQPWQPKPPPLQRGGSLRQRGPLPVHRVRLLRAATLGSSWPDEPPLGPTLELTALLSTPATAAASATAAAAFVAADAVPTAQSLLDGGAASRPLRRFSMDYEQQRRSGSIGGSGGGIGGGGGGGSPSVVPTIRGLAQRRVSIGSPGWGNEAAAKAAGGVGGSVSFRRQESGGGGCASGAGDAVSCGPSSSRDSFSGEKPGGGGGGGSSALASIELLVSYDKHAAASVTASLSASCELPLLRLDRLSTSGNADAAFRRTVVTVGGARAQQPGRPSEGGRPAPAPANSPAGLARFRASQSLPRSGCLDAGCSGDSGFGINYVGGGGEGVPGLSDDGAIDGTLPAEPLGLTTRGSQPRAASQQRPQFQRQRQQEQEQPPPQTQAWGSPGGAGPGAGSPRGAAPTASGLRVWHSLSMPRPQRPQESEGLVVMPQQQPRPAPQEEEEEEQQQPVPEDGPTAVRPRYRPARTASQGTLRLHGIPEGTVEGGAERSAASGSLTAVAQGRLTPLYSEPGNGAVHASQRVSGSGNGFGTGGVKGRFGGRVAYEVFGGGGGGSSGVAVGLQGGARRSPRQGGVEVFGGGRGGVSKDLD